MSAGSGRWLCAADRGGTFTDLVAVDPDGRLHTRKLLSQSPAYADALVAGLRDLPGLPARGPLAPHVGLLRVGTTVATNALLERKGEPVTLLCTRGLGDVLQIGDQSRPRLFDLDQQLPAPLYQDVLEVDERLDAEGRVLRAPDLTRLRGELLTLRRRGVRALAVVFLHSWLNPAHERAVGALAQALGFSQVSLSHACMRRVRITGRGRTAVVDAYLSPVLARYVNGLRAALGEVPLEFMQSAGGLAAAEHFAGRNAVLSGPAGGVVAVAGLAQARGVAAMGFDMGGTSTDVCRYAGGYERADETVAGGQRFQSEGLRIETVAAGGGSVLGFDGQRLTVGPESAGADPGPACYGRGGPATLTDANLVLGRLLPAAFPRQFGADQRDALQPAAARAALERLAERVSAATGQAWTPEALALGCVQVADQQMAKPIRALSVERGFDPRAHDLVCFGGAGGLHACAIAAALGIRRVLVHPLAGLFSAYGILRAERLETAQRSLLAPLDGAGMAAAQRAREALEAELAARLAAPPGEAVFSVWLDIRPEGSEGSIGVPAGDLDAVRAAWHDEHRHRFGFAPDDSPLELMRVRVEARLPGPLDARPLALDAGSSEVPPRQAVYTADGWQQVPCFDLGRLGGGWSQTGPALLVAAHYAVWVAEGFTATLGTDAVLQLEGTGSATGEGPEATVVAPGTAPDPVLLEVFNHRFMGLAEQMGAALVTTAHSVNMKERLDFSCALFDAAGGLVANAPHIPVHLGAMGESVKALLADCGDRLEPGQVWVSNNPARGGSHLPDVTVMTPVFMPGSAQPDFHLATRGHHADIGGRSPGSMDPFSRRLEDEGVVLDNLLLVAGGEFRTETVLSALGGGPWPARDLPERLSDLRAQVAANRRGETELQRLVEAYSADTVRAYMAHVQANAAHGIRRALDALLGGRPTLRLACRDALDDGTPIAVRLDLRATPAGPRLRVDFAGTGDAHDGSFNAPRAVVRAALMYVLRCLVPHDIPLNDGCMEPVELVVPPGSLLDPPPQAAVVAGNVETSQRVVDVLLGALGRAAASQGTMNNLILGFADGQYYETLGGGAGATAQGPGASAVQVHMTNTRITDPEVLERRYPVRLHRYALRRGSGGAGRLRGGDGLVREIELLAPARLTLLTQRRDRAPFGLDGGAPGAPGRNLLYRGDSIESLAAVGVWSLQPGERIRIETPGGGGYGAPGVDRAGD